ncbi:hypothetical protein AC579_138 [Pseudocercospora musae]|uniref:GST N-terminal domain-containing protein n=1 Tax=Pseudocercospora musae TaxID=113226 RepID=A0A139ILL3_9PEZI|nr:hypothetical protein AC579_138 [Pseudocercospora musae]
MSQSLGWLVLRIQDPGPNPQKVGIILEELQLPFDVRIIGSESEHSDRNEFDGSGGAPSVEDKNTGMIVLEDTKHHIILWESLAIVEYLIQTYDKERKLHYMPGTQNWWMCQQWLAYQMGAQSPFFSLKAWFSNQHQEKVPSVIQRFSDDVIRIASILEHYLKQNGRGYLVGEKCTFADLVFVPWNNKIEELASASHR